MCTCCRVQNSFFCHVDILSEVRPDHETKELTVAAVAVSLYHYAVCQQKVAVYAIMRGFAHKQRSFCTKMFS